MQTINAGIFSAPTRRTKDEGERMKDEIIDLFHPSSFILHPFKSGEVA